MYNNTAKELNFLPVISGHVMSQKETVTGVNLFII